jgi:hypothetical protein
VAEERQHKIAVIGATEPRYESREVRVECFPWNRLKKLTNLADYDVVILDLLSKTHKTLQDVDTFVSVLNEQSMLEVLVSKVYGSPHGIFYVLGDPRFSFVEEMPAPPGAPQMQDPPSVPRSPTSLDARPLAGNSAGSSRRVEIPFLHWTGMQFSWDKRPGNALERTWEASEVGAFKPFADKLGGWQYSLEECRLKLEVPDAFLPADRLDDLDYELKAEVEDICSTRYGTSIVFSVRIVAEGRPTYGRAGIGTSRRVHPVTGPIYFLPESQLSEEATLEFVLRDLCGIDVSAPEPEWVSQFVVPGQEEVDDEIDKLNARINGLRGDLARKFEEREEARQPLRLLYETGPKLEETVMSVLEALGAEVERPDADRKNKEESWVTVRVGDELFEGVLEVKGVKTKHFNTEGLRQLTTWIQRGISFRRKRYTGIFVGNSYREHHPRLRVPPFSKDWVEEAELLGYAAILTADLYALYLLDRTNRLDRDAFWRALFSTKGPFDMRPYLEEFTNEEMDRLGYPQ